ncbi:hypothetical protein MRBLMN1_001757, partial [Chitinophaga ginsengisegetis]
MSCYPRLAGIAIGLLSGTITVIAQTPNTSTKPTAAPVQTPAAYTNPLINYVRTWEPALPTTDTAYVASASRSVAEVRQTTAYVDGLGRPLQTVAKAMSFGGNDIVSPVVYDQFGREQAKYLPYVPQGVK